MGGEFGGGEVEVEMRLPQTLAESFILSLMVMTHKIIVITSRASAGTGARMFSVCIVSKWP